MKHLDLAVNGQGPARRFVHFFKQQLQLAQQIVVHAQREVLPARQLKHQGRHLLRIFDSF